MTGKKSNTANRIDSSSSDDEHSDAGSDYAALKCQKEDLAERYEHLEKLLLRKNMDSKARTFQDEIGEAIRDLRTAMFLAFGGDLDDDNNS